jgi:hypothetical protein
LIYTKDRGITDGYGMKLDALSPLWEGGHVEILPGIAPKTWQNARNIVIIDLERSSI